MEKLRTISALIDAFGGASEFAKIIGRGASTASEMKRSGSVRVEYWPKIIRGAAERKIPGISLKTLALMNLESRRRPDRSRVDDRSRASA